MSEKLTTLVQDLMTAKEQEKQAAQTRKELEEEITGQVAGITELPERGQRSVETDDGYKITVKKDMSIKADVQEIKAVCIKHGFETPPVKQKVTEELDTKGYEWLRENKPELFREIAEHVETKPRKPTVQIVLA